MDWPGVCNAAGTKILVALGEDIPRTATSTAFVPRQRARQDLEELWAHARGGQMAVALVSGPQGIGRSTWIRHVLRDLRKYDQALVLRGACHERETVAFKALDGMVDSLRRRLERIPEDDREKLFPPEFAALQRAFPALLALGEADTEPLDPQALGAESERAYSALAELPSEVGGLILVVPPKQTEVLVKQAKEKGIPRVWMQQGAESAEAIRFCDDNERR